MGFWPAVLGSGFDLLHWVRCSGLVFVLAYFVGAGAFGVGWDLLRFGLPGCLNQYVHMVHVWA